EALDPSGEEAAAERTVGDEADPELAAGRQDLLLRVAAPQRVFALQRRDRVDRVRATDRRRRCLGQAEKPHLALLHEVRHGAYGLLDRRRRIDAVLVVEIDHADAQAREARLTRGANVIGLAADAEAAAVFASQDAELGGDHDALAPSLHGFADELLVAADAVHVGGIEKVDAQLESALDRGQRFGLVTRTVELRHAHAAEA